MAGLAEQWFRLADEDRDGRISGGEAVRFFTRSGLPKDVLGQIWDLSSGGGPALNQLQFNTAMRLVALAQVSMGRLLPDQARAVAMGGGPQLPLPRMAGLDAPGAPGAPPPGGAPYTLQVTGAVAPPGYAPQVTGGSYAPQLTGASAGYGAPQLTGGGGLTPGYTPQPTGGGPPPRPPAFGGAPPPASYPLPQVTGSSYAPQLTGASSGYGPPPGAPGGWPPVSAEDMSRYRAQFGQLDRDGDGLVKGSDCFGVFMQTGLDKRVLKQIWDVVAGTSGALDAGQFVRAVYLIDCAKRGAPPPPALPPGQFPPLAAGVAMPAAPAAGAAGAAPQPGAAAAAAIASIEPPQQRPWTLDSQFGGKSAARAVSDSYDQTLPKLPGVPGKVAYDASGAPVPAARASEVPDLGEEVTKMLAGPDKARFEGARGEAVKREEELRKAEADAEAAKHRLKVFQEALAEVMLFRSRADVALLQAQDQASRLAAEAEETERRYHTAHLAAQGQFAASEEARKELQAALAKKQEAANRLSLLQQELAMLSNMNPQEMAALQAEVAGLVSQVAAAESKKAALELQLDSGRKQRGLLAARAADLDLAAAAGEAELGRVLAELGPLSAKVEAALAAPVLGGGEGGEAGGEGGGGGRVVEVGDLRDALVRAAGAYRSLFSALQGRGGDVPYEAALNNVGALVWVDTLMAGAADWMDGDLPVVGEGAQGGEAGPGYAVVNALPELEGVPPALLRAAGGPARLAGPLKRAGAAAATGALSPFASSDFGDHPSVAPGAPAPPPAASGPSAPALGLARSGTADSAAFGAASGHLHNPFSYAGVPAAVTGQSDATDSSAFEDNAF